MLEAREGLGAGIELAPGARDEATGFHVVHLDALLAFGRVTELLLVFEARSFGKHPHEGVAVSNLNGFVVEQSLAGFLATEGVTNLARRGDEEFDGALPGGFLEVIAQG